MSSLSGEEYKCMEPIIAIDGAPSARLPESEAGDESEVGVESEAGVETERPLTVRNRASKAAQRNSW